MEKFKQQMAENLSDVLDDMSKLSILGKVTGTLRHKSVDFDDAVSKKYLNLKLFFIIKKDDAGHERQLFYVLTNKDLEKYGIKQSNLENSAKENMVTKESWRVYDTIDYVLKTNDTFSYVLNSAAKNSMVVGEKSLMPSPIPMGSSTPDYYVISNRRHVFGGSALWCSPSLSELYEKIGAYYIIPKSIHEIFCVPKKSIMKKFKDKEQIVKEELSDLLFEFNKKAKKTDILSYNLYFYNEKRISRIIVE